MAKKSAVASSEVQKWADRIKSAETERDRIAKLYHWDRIKDQMKGEFSKTLGRMKGTPIVPVNLVHAFIRTAIPNLYFRDPKLAVNPRGASFIPKAKIMEPALNYRWKRLGMKREIKKGLGDAVGWAGHAWFKTGYTADIEEPAEGTKDKDATYETSQSLRSEKIWSMRVSPKDVVFNNDESIDPPYDCRWIAHRLPKSLEAAKKMFPGNDDLKATYIGGLPDDEGKAKSKSVAGKSSGVPMVIIREITSMDTNEILYIADGHDRFLKDPMKFPYEMNGFNWTMMKFNPVPDEAYPYPDLFIAEPQIWEITKLLSMALNHIKRFSRQLIIEEGTMNESEMSKFEQGIDGAVIQARKGSMAQGSGPAPVPYPPIQTDLYNILDRLMVMFDNIIGQSAFDRGSTAQTRTRTLGEVDKIQRGTEARSSEKQDIVEDCVEEIAEKIAALMKQYTDVPEFVAQAGLNVGEFNKILQAASPELAGKMADATGFQYTKEDINGNFDIEVVAGSMKPLDTATRNDLLVQILRFGQSLGLMPNDPASNEIGMELFHNLDMFGVANAFEQKVQLNSFQSQVQALAQQRQQLQTEIQSLSNQRQMLVRGQAAIPSGGMPK